DRRGAAAEDRARPVEAPARPLPLRGPRRGGADPAPDGVSAGGRGAARARGGRVAARLPRGDREGPAGAAGALPRAAVRRPAGAAAAAGARAADAAGAA